MSVLDLAKSAGGDGDVTLRPTAVASLPAASTAPNAIRLVTGATGSNPTLCISNGTVWININTGLTVVAA